MNIENELQKSPVLNALFNSMPEMIFVFDKNKKIQAVNKAVEDFLKDKYKNFYIEEIFGEAVKCEVVVSHEECLYGAFCNDCVVSNTVNAVLDTGEPVYNKEGVLNITIGDEIRKLDVLITSYPFETDGDRYIILTITDITETKKIQKERIKILESLAFIGGSASGIIHDLKNPLTGIKGFLYLLQNENNPKVREKYSEKMEYAVDRIQDMISEILEIAAGKDSVKLEKEKINVSKFLHEIVADMKLESKIIMEIDKESIVNVDKNKIHQVLWNIIKNADEANPKDSGVIKISSYEKGKYQIITIADNGKGIPEEIMGKIFTPGKTFGKKNGNGFGLFSAKKIIEAHNGIIDFESSIHKGTIFFIKIPIFANNLL